MLHVSDEGRPLGERGVTMPNLLPLALLSSSPFGTLPCPPVRVVGGGGGPGKVNVPTLIFVKAH